MEAGIVATAAMAKDRGLAGKVAIVTGGSRGIGREICLQLAAEGTKVVVNFAGNATAGDAVSNDIEAMGGEALAVRGDISKTFDVEELFSATLDRFGEVNFLINTAGLGTSTYHYVGHLSEEEWDKTFEINAKGTFVTNTAAANSLSEGGRIINFSSTIVALDQPGYSAYAASKAAVETFTKILSKELRGKKITANVIAPGPTATELFFNGKDEATIEKFKLTPPLERLGYPEDIANAVLFLLSSQGEWVNGQVLKVNGGLA